ncbi:MULTISPECIES: 2-isopropylmalate synthase [unclassified Streptomyces]|uniref:2-isopropylmalate synthase n=1 Tax=unclassified Streptomyces TaxID=2593676 RepID=UPI00037FCCBA|nr:MULTISPECIES: 2-isopropylmalate synthase [unclassified Streptomyces]MYY04496.1 2-isopropylmalate synthase [Streptomyces sp. SID4913]
MVRFDSSGIPPAARLRTPCALAPAEQPAWNPQLGSSMPARRYTRPSTEIPALPHRDWPSNSLTRAPLWSSVDLRDGNQALPEPMDPRRKTAFFDLLLTMGFKDIEVGYPSASRDDFDFVRHLVRSDLIPDDVTISVFTPARPDLIDRTFEAIAGARRAMVHLCNATAPRWRDTVFGMTRQEVARFATRAATRVLRRADELTGTTLRFEYSPETFNNTEPEYALEVCDSVTALWDAAPDRPVTINLPATVETHTPNLFADQVEWMHRNLARRDSVILSVHPHNDRGTAVAATELALLAGADRVEGTLFGNGERTGNVCLATLALNLFSTGVDPQLDLSDIDGVRRTVEWCTRMPVHPRHPYVGDLVYTAFSGTHQDAVKKGLEAMDRAAGTSGTAAGEEPWQVPYLPVDPADLGRSYEAVVRINSQSGKSGVAYVLKTRYGFDLPRSFQAELAAEVQETVDAEGTEIGAPELWTVFSGAFLHTGEPLNVVAHHPGNEATVELERTVGSERIRGQGTGPDATAAFLRALSRCGVFAKLLDSGEHPGSEGTVAYRRLEVGGVPRWGAGTGGSDTEAELRALTAAACRALRASAAVAP